MMSLIYCLIMIDRVAIKISKAQDERLDHLSHVITQINDDDDIDSLKATYKETIYYKGFAYHFDENGFVDKTKIDNEEVVNKSQNTVIKVTEENDESTKIDEIKIDE